jgi:Ca-activated chloride channel family protein
LFLSLFIGTRAYAQKAAIHGVVYNATKNSPLDYVTVTVNKKDEIVGLAYTEPDGTFKIIGLDTGTYNLKIKYIGYSEFILSNIHLKNSIYTIKDTIKLEKNTTLKTIVIQDRKPLMVAGMSSQGTTITTEEIKKSPVRDLNSLVGAGSGNVYQKDASNIQIGGSRTNGQRIIVDGLPLRSGVSIPVGAINLITQPSENEYGKWEENIFEKVVNKPLSTFSIDVDKAAYSMVRRQIESGIKPITDVVRIEEMINYFNYNYPSPKADTPISIIGKINDCAWNKKHKIAQIALKAFEIDYVKAPACNLVFLIDVSGSMQSIDRLPLIQQALKMLTLNMRPIDKIAIVTYAGNAGLALPSTLGNEKVKICDAIDRLTAGGSTAGGEGIALAYKIAEENLIASGNNRIILSTDGDFNVGITNEKDLLGVIEEYKSKNIFLSVLGVGMGNYKDSRMEQLADKGNGNYFYLDNIEEAHNVLVKQIGATIYTVAKDVKLQIEFNPKFVSSYKLIGYENRKLADDDFKNDKKDAGEMGSGSTVTALYELVPTNDSQIDTSIKLKYQHMVTTTNTDCNEWMTVSLRYKDPKQNTSKLIVKTIADSNSKKVDDDFGFINAVVEASLVMRNSNDKAEANLNHAIKMAKKYCNDDQAKKDFVKMLMQADELYANK